jgi:SAM-dependent methyltransferase
VITALRPALGAFDLVELTESELRLAGWMVWPERALDAIKVFWNDEARGQVTGLSRRDDVLAVNRSLRHAAHSGFEVRLPVTAGGRGRVDLVGYSEGKAVTRLGLRLFGVAEMSRPQPPAELTLRVAGVQGDGFRLRGLKCLTDLLDQAERHGLPREGARILDWGCGCGGLSALFLRHCKDVRLDGCDVDPRGIEWCQANLPGGRFVSTGTSPPLPYEDASFDLVVGSSVFTHLQREDQRTWLAELRRVLRPGGLLLASTMGPRVFKAHLERPGRRYALLRKTLFFFSGFDGFQPDRSLSGIAPDGWYRDVFQSPRQVRREWSKFLEVVDHLEQGLCGSQDLVVLRR